MDFLLDDLERARTARQLNLPGFGVVQQEALKKSHILIVGAGGLGCPALQQLAAAGIGNITIIDDDVVDITNIHRQILFGAGDVGKNKVDIAATRARELQPSISVTPLHKRLTPANACELIGSVDLVLDGSDSFSTKYLVADAAEITGTPLVWGTVLRFHGDVALWHSGPENRGVGLRDVFPHQLDAHAVPDCATAGVLGVTTSVVGGLMATLAIAWLSGLDRTVGRITSYEAIPAIVQSYTATTDPARERVLKLQESYETTSGDEASEHDSLETAQLLDEVKRQEAVLLDIREPGEVIIQPFPSQLRPCTRPLSTLADTKDISDFFTELGTEHTAAVVACASGKRSAQFIDNYRELAEQAGIALKNLPGGMRSLS